MTVSMAALDERKTTPLWTADEVAAVTSGSWVRPPGSSWCPQRVRSTLFSDVMPGWLDDGIVFIFRERHLARWLANEESPTREPTGCVVVDKTLADSDNLPRERALLVVDNSLAALRALAAAARARHEGRVVAVTGTVGKTTVRGMIVHLLQAHGPVLTNHGNDNLRPHVLEQMASVPPEVPLAVYEVGLGGYLGALGDVSGVLRPDVVVVTQLDVAHLDTISRTPLTREEALLAVARQKVQLCRHLAPEGLVLLHRDVPIFEEILSMLAGRRVVSFGTADDADYRLLGVEARNGVVCAHATAGGQTLDYELTLPGRFMAVNGLGAIAASAEVTGDVHGSAAALATFKAVRGRARVLRVAVNGAPITLIDDSFNATPLSMRSTLQLLGDSEPGPGGRRIAVLGDIAHLGHGSAETHARLADSALEHKVDRVYTLGSEMLHLHDALPPPVAAGHFKDKRELVDALVADLRAGDVVTVKASVPQQFDHVVQMLLALDAGATVRQAQARPAPPTLPVSRLLLDGDTGETLLSENADVARDPAALAKMMTLYLIFEEFRGGRLTLDDELVASASAARERGSRLRLNEGQRLSLHEAICGLAIVSANDAAVVVAEHLSGDTPAAFVDRMNAKATELGLTATRFANASGSVNRTQTATAADMALLGYRLYTDFPGYRPWYSHPSLFFHGKRQPATNSLLMRYRGLNGIKTGTVVPGSIRHLVGSAVRDGRCFIGVVMGCRDLAHRDEEMTALLDLGFESGGGGTGRAAGLHDGH